MKYFLVIAFTVFQFIGCQSNGSNEIRSAQLINYQVAAQDTFPVNKTEKEWKAILTPQEYRILRQAGTEKPFDNKYEKHKETGVYVCAACGHKLFKSNTKYESFCGWPSFWDTIDESAITTREDNRYGMKRTEIVCANCGGHLGHVFKDGPPPTGLRYCLNSVAMNFIPADSLK